MIAEFVFFMAIAAICFSGFSATSFLSSSGLTGLRITLHPLDAWKGNTVDQGNKIQPILTTPLTNVSPLPGSWFKSGSATLTCRSAKRW
jgi:hypothetical protein